MVIIATMNFWFVHNFQYQSKQTFRNKKDFGYFNYDLGAIRGRGITIAGSRGRLVWSRGRLVGGRGRFVGSGLVWLLDVGLGLTLVFHIGNVSIFVVSVVGNNLNSAVGKLNTVFTRDGAVFILSLSLGEMSAVFVSTSIFISKGLGGLFLLMVGCGMVGGRVWGGRMVGGRMISTDHAHQR